MTITSENFLSLEQIHNLNTIDRFVAILWWHHHSTGSKIIPFASICQELEDAGYSPVNKSREKAKLAKDSRTIRSKNDEFRLNVKAINELDSCYMNLLECKPITKSNSLFTLNDFSDTRGYIQKVVVQINLSYDHQLYDCCTVMIRRLLETLIIEVYEKLGRADELKNSDGNFMMLSGLVAFLKNEKTVNIGRQTMSGLENFKKIADSSAHNRRYNASKKDVDDKISDIRLSVNELVATAFT